MTLKDMNGIQLIRRISSGYWACRLLLTASKYDVFELLEKPMTARAVAGSLSLDSRATEILLDAVTALGFLRKSGNRYRNSRVSSRFLVKGKPYYQGDILMHHAFLYERWSELDEIVKTGRPSRKGRDHSSFIKGMHNIASLRSKEVISLINIDGVRRVMDLGGGPGTYSVEFAKKGLDVTLCDLKETFRISEEIISSCRFRGKVSFLPADFMTDDIGSGYDLVFISQIIHMLGEKDIVRLFRKAGRSLNNGGRIVVQELLVNDRHTGPLQGALFAVNMLVNTGGGRTYSPSEISGFLRKAGYTSVRKTLLQETVLMEARKPAG
ncbi:demethylspheroidene O-methyltransferase [bacterium BMS3Abin07]|nr:demethylspheroidene O-methyltransferase [bacterium BMS3Abin07]GBE32134.1 demethylspheroidene O-methyltransferase [bacterium BMS3Bbin05]HDL20604.1 methyltransferase domain-containing protein [Nitrospirota bacterium]HDO22216.1 methyltransferase domain-containing protein [Nitrospirota bacterium]HDZ88845.1 methyltransferase domain-containing protein [Nitrospirota bacterium]